MSKLNSSLETNDFVLIILTDIYSFICVGRTKPFLSKEALK